MNETVNLAMPYGLPNLEADMLEHYRRLGEETALQLEEDNTVQVFGTDAPEWSSLYALCRCIAMVLPIGSAAPNGGTLDQPAILIKPWFWDFLQMAENSGGGLLPNKILYRNIDIIALRTDIQQEITNNERYRLLSPTQRSQVENQFIAGEIKLLFASETRIGMGRVQMSGEYAGKRSFKLQFFEANNTLIDPNEVAEIFSLVGGRTINGHPFTKQFSIPVWPNIAPLEGGIRFKIEGIGFVTGTTITVGDVLIPAIDISISPDRNVLYVTVPPRPISGSVDVVIHQPGSADLSFSNALTYKTSTIDAIRSTVLSLAVSLSELQARIELDPAIGTDEASRNIRFLEIEQIFRTHGEITVKRSGKGGGSLRLPQIQQVLDNNRPLISAKYRNVLALLRS